MDELSILRRVRSDVLERDEDSIRKGRAELFRAMQQEGPERRGALRSPSRKPGWTPFALVGAAAVAGSLVVANVVANPAGAEPAAASVLSSAADATINFTDPSLASGQYLRVRTDAVYLFSGDVEATATRAPEDAGGYVLTAESAAFTQAYHDELFVPADREQDWVWVQCQRSTAETFGALSEALAKETSESDSKYAPSVLRRLPAGQLPDAGAFDGYQLGSERGSADGDLAALPRDPRALLDHIYSVNGAAGQSRDGEALVWIADVLRKGTAPADLRAALYRAAALIPGVTITDEQAHLNGRSGVAIGRIEADSNTRQDLIIDRSTGLFVGERVVSISTVGDVPAGSILSSASVTTNVVDSAPVDASTCGA